MSRTLLIGDVHGCLDELRELVEERAKLDARDQLVQVGDMVARGPASAKVVRYLRDRGARCVLGNHEARLLAYRRGERARLNATHAQVAGELTADDWSFLATAPLTLDLPEHGLRVVHAGMDPRVPWQQQAPEVLCNIRALDDGSPWGASYRGPPHVVFGHDARAGLQLHAWCTGLDTGCVYGGKLTGLLLEAGEPIPNAIEARRSRLLQVEARRVYFKPG